MFRKILVPLDSTEVSQGIIPIVTDVAVSTEARVVLLTVLGVDTPGDVSNAVRQGTGGTAEAGRYGTVPAPTSMEPATEGGPYRAQLDEKAADDAEQRLRGFVRQLGDAGVEASTAVSFGTPARAILKAAQEQGCDLIAMSTHARSGIGRLLMGSVTEEVIRGSNLPVLTIKPEKS